VNVNVWYCSHADCCVDTKSRMTRGVEFSAVDRVKQLWIASEGILPIKKNYQSVAAIVKSDECRLYVLCRQGHVKYYNIIIMCVLYLHQSSSAPKQCCLVHWFEYIYQSLSERLAKRTLTTFSENGHTTCTGQLCTVT